MSCHSLIYFHCKTTPVKLFKIVPRCPHLTSIRTEPKNESSHYVVYFGPLLLAPAQPTDSIRLSVDDYQCNIVAYKCARSRSQRIEEAQKATKNEKNEKISTLHVDGTKNHNHTNVNYWNDFILNYQLINLVFFSQWEWQKFLW